MTIDRRHDAPASADRTVVFTDAVAAIGITLLVLPLVELIPGAADDRAPSLSHLIGDHVFQFGAFVLSFLVIFRFWWAHHRLFARIRRVTVPMVILNGIWCFGVVFLPVPTGIITAYSPSSLTVGLYVATLGLLSGSLTAIAVYAHRRPDLCDEDRPLGREWVLGYASVFVAQLVALVIGVLFGPVVSYYPLLLILLSAPVERVVLRRWARRARTT